MRILKKVIRKLYHLIWFLSVFLIFTPSVFAVTGNPNTNGTDFYTPPAVTFYDNTNENLTQLSTSFNNTGKYYSSDIIFNGADTAGANVSMTLFEPLQYGYTYSLVILVGAPYTFKVSTKRVCVAENAANTVARWHNNWCVTPTFTDQMGGVNFNVVDSSYSNTIGYTALYYIFTSNVTARSVNVAFNSATGSNSSTVILGGYKLTLLSDNTGLTSSQLQSAINSAGVAKAQDVQELENAINDIPAWIDGVQQRQNQTNKKLDDIDDTLNDSNVDSSDSTINNLKDKIPTNSVISDLLLLPVRFLQNFVNALGSSCSRFSLGSLYGTELFMPCINIENYLGSGIWTTIDLIISGLFVYSLRKKFIEIYENLTNLKNGGNEVD